MMGTLFADYYNIMVSPMQALDLGADAFPQMPTLPSFDWRNLDEDGIRVGSAWGGLSNRFGDVGYKDILTGEGDSQRTPGDSLPLVHFLSQEL